MNKNDERFLMKVTDLYFNEEMSQEKIAKNLDVSRTTISRALSKAKKYGYVKISLNFPEDNAIDLEKRLEAVYHMKEVVVVKAGHSLDLDYQVSRAASFYLARTIKSKMVLGMTWGNPMKRIIDTFEADGIASNLRVRNVEVVPLLGTNAPIMSKKEDLSLCYSNLLSAKLAELVGGTSYSLPAPMYVSSAAMRSMLLLEPQVKFTLDKAKECDMAIFGVGTLDAHSSVAALDPRKTDLISSLLAAGGIGEIAARVFDAEGQAVASDLDDRLIALTLEQIRRIPIRIGMAYGKRKIQAIEAAIKSGLLNVLITDFETAEALLEDAPTNM